VRLISITLGNRRGELEVRGVVNIPKKTTTFQAIVNGLIVCEGDYESMSDIMREVFELNRSDKPTESKYFPALVPGETH
jgi:hypothetical protein